MIRPVIGGRYRHYKGNEYTVLAVARHSETLEETVVYRAEYGAHDVWVRPLPMFMENVTEDGGERRRFACVHGTLIRPADPSETDAVEALYRRCVGLPGVTWNENYPTREMAAEDIAAGQLHVLYEGESLVGAVTLLWHDDLDELPVWNPAAVRPAVPVRLAVDPARQGQGWGRTLMEYAMRTARESGADSLRLLCACGNEAAAALYRRLGFAEKGGTEMYGHRYLCMEKLLCAEK